MWINRAIQDKLLSLSASRPVVLLTGARQTGKTSLLRRAFPDHHYVSLDLPTDAQTAENNPDLFFQSNPTPLIIDEIQYAPSLFRHLKAKIDRDRSQKGQYLLTGSQKFSLMKGIQESLAGRVALVELLPVSIQELGFPPPRSVENLGNQIIRGFFPELQANPEIDAFEYYRSYVLSYLERDVREVLNVNSLRDFERFLRACALRAGQLINKSDLARDVGISPTTANEWLSVLSASNQVHILEPWFSNRTKSIVKTPKLYFYDTGLLSFLLNIRDAKTLLGSPLFGAVWENFVFAELFKTLSFSSEQESLFFWRDRGKEIDFVVNRGGRFLLLEAKASAQPELSDLAGFQVFGDQIGTGRTIGKRVVCSTTKAFSVSKDITAHSVYDRSAWQSG